MDFTEIFMPLNNVFVFSCQSLFICATLESRWSKKISLLAVFGGAFLFTAPVVNYFYHDLILKTVIVNVFDVFILLRIFFKDSILRIILIKSLALLFLAIVEMTMSIIAYFILQISLQELFLYPRSAVILTLTAYYPALLILYYSGAKIINNVNYKSLSRSDALRLGLFPFSQTILLVALTFFSGIFTSTTLYATNFLAFILCLMMCIAANLLLFRTVKDVERQTKMEVQNIYLRQQKKMQLQHYQAFIEQQENVRKLRHDIINHVQTMKLLISQNEMMEADEYADKLAERFHKISTIDYCENKVIDAVLHNKMEYAQSLQVEGSAQLAVPEACGIDDLDLMAIFSNLLDNAIQAASKAEKGKFFAISSIVRSGFLIIKMENSGDGSEIPKIHSISKQKKHGLGLNIIREITEKYDGTFETIQNDLHYVTVVTLRCG